MHPHTVPIVCTCTRARQRRSHTFCFDSCTGTTFTSSSWPLRQSRRQSTAMSTHNLLGLRVHHGLCLLKKRCGSDKNRWVYQYALAVLRRVCWLGWRIVVMNFKPFLHFYQLYIANEKRLFQFPCWEIICNDNYKSSWIDLMLRCCVV